MKGLQGLQSIMQPSFMHTHECRRNSLLSSWGCWQIELLPTMKNTVSDSRCPSGLCVHQTVQCIPGGSQLKCKPRPHCKCWWKTSTTCSVGNGPKHQKATPKATRHTRSLCTSVQQKHSYMPAADVLSIACFFNNSATHTAQGRGCQRAKMAQYWCRVSSRASSTALRAFHWESTSLLEECENHSKTAGGSTTPKDDKNCNMMTMAMHCYSD